jgi:hypothetical protein
VEELVVLGHPERRVEMLDHDDLDPGLLEEADPFLGIEEERWRCADDHLIRMRVERDHRRPSAAAARLGHEVPEQVLMTEVDTVEDADHGEERPVTFLEPIDPIDDGHIRVDHLRHRPLRQGCRSGPCRGPVGRRSASRSR